MIPKPLFLYLTCFFTGAVILILEVLGFRLFAPYFGSSVFVSGSLIGIILTAISLGYWGGGKWADRFPQEKKVYSLVFVSSLYLFGMYFFYKPLLSFFQHWSVLWGTIPASIVLFAPPMILLSTVSPYLIRLHEESRKLQILILEMNGFLASSVPEIIVMQAPFKPHPLGLG